MPENRYRKVRKIDDGTFGEIYLGIDTLTNEDVAIKVEKTFRKCSKVLQNEYKIYQNLPAGLGVTKVRWYGTLPGNEVILVLDLLGPSLEELLNYCGGVFSMKTCLMLADQMVARIEYFHNHNFIHRDIKPANFLFGLGAKNNMMHLINFGLARRYKDNRTNKHIRCGSTNGLTGTARYTSLNAHRGIEQSRRDDLESLGYVLLYFQGIDLPWQGIKCKNRKQKQERIGERKRTTPLSQLCKNCPKIFKNYLKYCRGLKFEEKPDYVFIRQCFRTYFLEQNYSYDNDFDWKWEM